MIVEAQEETVQALMASATHAGAVVERIDTHSAIVFLAGDRAWKLKRAVRFDYLDYGTRDRRREACEAEVRINRRTAPSIYLGVAAVTRDAGGRIALDGQGEPVDWVIEMTRFDQADLLDRRAAAGTLDLSLMRRLADAIARFHRGAERREDHGGLAGMRWVVSGNAEGFGVEGRDILDADHCVRVTSRSQAELARQATRLERRRAGGHVRHCHGDLHLRNLVLLDGRPTLFDAIEFSDEIACIDTLYDLSFLLMDLWKGGLPHHANAVLNRYVAETDDLEDLALLPLFLSCRAAVRAKTSSSAARVQDDPARRRCLERTSRTYLTMAEEFLHPEPPRLIAIGGRSGSGKSTLAERLAAGLGALPGALVLRSDEIRKALHGVPRLQRLSAAAYAADANEPVYREMAERAAVGLLGGRSVIADAVFARTDDRQAIERVAVELGVPFDALWLDAPARVLIDRVTDRAADPSDADEAVVRAQIAQPLGDLAWRVLDASGAPEVVARRAARDLEANVGLVEMSQGR